MSVDGLPERAAIMARAKTIAGGRSTKGVLDEETHQRFLAGDAKPYFGFLFGTPTPAPRGASITGLDKDTPHMMMFTVAAYAGDPDLAERASSQMAALLRDWRPTVTTTTITGEGGSGTASNLSGQKKPSRFVEYSHWSFIINMGPDA